MKTLTIINAVFSAFFLLMWLKTPTQPLPGQGEQISAYAQPGIFDALFMLWGVAFAICSLVYVFKKEKTA